MLYRLLPLNKFPQAQIFTWRKVVIQDDHLTIIEENDAQTGKDSSRMLAAGASRSFFVMATDEQLVKAIDKIINLNGSDTYYICESGGLRQYVVPGVFILVSHHGKIKENKDLQV